MRISFFKVSFLFAAVAVLVSCDKDFNEIGTGVVGDDHYLFDKDSLYSVKAVNQFYGDVQTSKTTTSSIDLPINSLGYYNNSVFGKVRASFVTQLELANEAPDFGDSVHVKKVELSIPYFSHVTAVDDDGNRLYQIDSLQGSSKIKLSVFASNYYLRDFDPETGLQEVQKYYSDQLPLIDANLGSSLLNDSTATRQNSEFFFDPAEVVTYKTNDQGLQVIDKRDVPQMKLSLNRAFFREKIFGLAADGSMLFDTQSKLINNNVFKDYFRGLYFKVEPAASSSNQGSLAQLNFGNGKITITYSILTNRKYTTGPNIGDYVVDEDGHREREDKTYILNLRGNTVNFFENEYNPEYISAVTNPNTTTGDDRLWLKGGAGSMAIIDLFGADADNDGTADELEDLRTKGWLINDASLTFYVDTDKMGSEKPNYRVYLYDLDNRRPLVDYVADVSTVSGFPQYNKYVHGGLLPPGKDFYTIKLTNHIRNLVKNDSTNVRLGLVVTETINNVSNKKLKTPISDRLDRVPGASVSKQRGVVLYGSTPQGSPADEAKRLRLRIYYTKPE